MSRCYVDHADVSCTADARYEARLNWTAGRMLLCEEHAAEERAHDDVVSIKTLRPTRPVGPEETE